MQQKSEGLHMITREDIIKYMDQPAFKPMKRSELAKRLNITDSNRRDFRTILKKLLTDGTVIKIKKKFYTLPVKAGLVVGTLRAHSNGFGFVIQEEEGKDDIYIPKHAMSTAMNGDKVLVSVDPDVHDPFAEEKNLKSGCITRIIERKNDTVVGTLAKNKHFYYVIPDDPRIYHDIYIPTNHLSGAKPRNKVVIKINEWPSKHLNPEGEVLEVLGHSEDPKTDIISIIRKHELPEDFHRSTLNEAKKVPEKISAAEIAGRRDLRNVMTVTIDPEDAKDFDDAISLTRNDDGSFILGVHIADVSHYVQPGSHLDKEARERGTSVYLPDRVIPMLPPQLSNNICSLRENEDRLVKSVLIHLTRDYKVKRHEFTNSIIRSDKRFNYKEAYKILCNDKDMCSKHDKFVLFLNECDKISREMHKKRIERGSIILNLPEIKVKMDSDGNAVGLERVEMDSAHTLIEEFMLAANEAVAKHLSHKGFHSIYRIHDLPEKDDLDQYAILLEDFGYHLNTSHIDVKQLQKILNKAKDTPEERIINIGLLRSLKIAEYSTRNIGHFALGLKYYSHFTSPIRRYPDLIVHRIMDLSLNQAQKTKSFKADINELKVIAKHCCKTERTAADAENDAVDLKKLQYLDNLHKSRRIHKMEGIITTIKNSGFFVEIPDMLIDGFVRLSSLKDDFYDLMPGKHVLIGRRRKRKFKTGQKVNVRIDKIDLYKKQVDFIIN